MKRDWSIGKSEIDISRSILLWAVFEVFDFVELGVADRYLQKELGNWEAHSKAVFKVLLPS